MLIKYKGTKTVLREGLRIQYDATSVFSRAKPQWHTATVVDVLSTQFTALDMEDKIIFRFFADVGRTWKPVTDAEDQLITRRALMEK